MCSGTHGSFTGIVSMIGVPSPVLWPSVLRARRVEARGHEDRAAAAVEVEHRRRVGRQQEPVVDGPLADLGAAALQDGDVERVDLRLDRITCRARSPPPAWPRRRRTSASLGRRDLALEPLQRPAAAALDLRRDAGQRHDRSDLLALPAELERRDVALDTVVVRGERRRARELDGAVLADQTRRTRPPARPARPRRRAPPRRRACGKRPTKTWPTGSLRHGTPKSCWTGESDDARVRPVPRNPRDLGELFLGDAVVRDVGREGAAHVVLVEADVGEGVGVRAVLGLGLGRRGSR